jgi:hypothetical protein
LRRLAAPSPWRRHRRLALAPTVSSSSVTAMSGLRTPTGRASARSRSTVRPARRSRRLRRLTITRSSRCGPGRWAASDRGLDRRGPVHPRAGPHRPASQRLAYRSFAGRPGAR